MPRNSSFRTYSTIILLFGDVFFRYIFRGRFTLDRPLETMVQAYTYIVCTE